MRDGVPDVRPELETSVDVAELSARIEREAARQRGEATSPASSSVEDLLIVAEARAAVRTRLPARPFFGVAPVALVGRVLLRALAFVSKDQRATNLALVAALRQSVTENRALAERVRVLEAAALRER